MGSIPILGIEGTGWSHIEERNGVVYTTPKDMREMSRLRKYNQDFGTLLSKPFSVKGMKDFILKYPDIVELDFDVGDGYTECELAIQYNTWKDEYRKRVV